MTAGTALCLICPTELMSLFTSVPENVQAGVEALRIICIGFIASSVSVTACGALEGLSKGIPSLIISMCRYLVIMLPAAFILSRSLGAVGVWHGFWVAELLTAVVALAVMWKSTRFTD